MMLDGKLFKKLIELYPITGRHLKKQALDRRNHHLRHAQLQEMELGIGRSKHTGLIDTNIPLIANELTFTDQVEDYFQI